MRDIKADPYGIDIMLPKAQAFLIKVNSVSNIAANILKQEMLSLGAEVVVARGALTGKSSRTDCLLMGNLSQFNRLTRKLSSQPFGLKELARGLSEGITNYQKNDFFLDLGRHKLALRQNKALVMGIMNLTPDSFSGDGLYKSQVEDIVEYAERIARDGADIIDIGGESTRPGARPVPLKEELRRTIPVIKKLAKKIKIPISIDTYKPAVAEQALDNGAVMVNCIQGDNVKMAKTAAKYKAGLALMHIKGRPLTMQKNPEYGSLLDDIIEYLDRALKAAVENGMDRERTLIDPGIGFGKTLKHNLEILKRLGELKVLGRPILAGPSRKSFIGKILGAEARDRIYGSVSSCVTAVRNGANIVRVHDVKAVKEALKVSGAIMDNP
ncbi:MAG: dihydropteroate synthase [Candidatus Omnitrophica bacterium]|nr:dihydropteroate synthase [Candidatus Omnitrophota bacterium]